MLRQWSTIIVLVGVLAGGLAAVNQWTREPIQANRSAAEWQAARRLTGIADLGGPWDPRGQMALPDGRTLIQSIAPGYAGPIEMLVVLGATGVQGIAVTRHTETPGIADFLGDPEHPWMRGLNRRPLTEIDAVSGATITSDAVVRVLRQLQMQARP